MILAYDYPLLGLFWSMMWFFFLVAWLMTLFRVFGDIFRSRDMGGFAKAIWLFFVIAMPVFGVLVYLIARGGKMADRDIEEARAREEAFQDYVRQTAGTSAPADQIAKLAALRDSGAISDVEFEAGKAKIFG